MSKTADSWAHDKAHVAHLIEERANAFGENHKLEKALFMKYAGQIPDYINGIDTVWASVIVGFEAYAKENAINSVADNFTVMQYRSLGGGGTLPGSPRQLAPGGLNLGKEVNESASIYLQAIVLLKNGPQVFNKEWYESAWGKPPRPWRDYLPGWTVLDTKK